MRSPEECQPDDGPWARTSRFAQTEPYQDRPEPLHQTLQERAACTQAPDGPEATPKDARWRDAQRLRLAAQLVESICLPDAETGPGRVAIAGLRRWIVDVAKGARSQSETLEDA